MNMQNWFRSLLTNKSTTRSRRTASKRSRGSHGALESLEDRTLLTPTVALSGADHVDQGAPYDLTLGPVVDADHAIVQYVVHWGDATSSTYTEDDLVNSNRTVTHTYSDAGMVSQISVDLIEDPQAFSVGTNIFVGVATASVTVDDVAPIATISGRSGHVVLGDVSSYHGSRGSAVDPTTGDIVVLDSSGGTMLRYRSNGRLIGSVPFDGAVSGPSGVAIDSIGRILIGGSLDQGATSSAFAVARYLHDGTLDTTFGDQGVVTIDMGSTNDYVNALILDDLGRILVVGDTLDPVTRNSHVGVARLTSMGALDTSFGARGKTVSSFSNNDHGLGVAQDPLTKTLAVLATTSSGYAIVRYTTAGALDGSSGHGTGVVQLNGFVASGQTFGDISGGIAITSEGKLLIGGGINYGMLYDGFSVYRYNTDGTLDTSFGANGIASHFVFSGAGSGNYYNARVSGVTLDSNGGMLLTGSTGYNDADYGESSFLGLARLTASGTPDVSFGDIGGAPANANESSLVNFAANFSDFGGVQDAPYQYAWSVTSSNGQVISGPSGTISEYPGIIPDLNFTPRDNGSYQVKLTVSDKFGKSSVTTQDLNVVNVSPVPLISSLTGTFYEGASSSLSGSGSDVSAVDQATLTFQWSVAKNGVAFGSVKTGKQFSFTPDDNGTYLVTLAAQDKDGGKSTTSTSITVLNSLPVVPTISNPPSSGTEGSTITLNGSATDAGSIDQKTLQFSWSVTKNGVIFRTNNNAGSQFNFVPDDNGSYVVTLKVTDKDGGASQTISPSITIKNVAPTATLNAPSIVSEGESISLSFTNTNDLSSVDLSYALHASFAFDGKDSSLATTYATASTLFYASGSFKTFGTYTVKARIFDKDGGYSTYAADIIVMRNRQFGTTKTDEITGTAVDSTGTYVVGYTDGTLIGSNLGGSDAFLRKYKTDGTVAWTTQFGTNTYDIASGIAVDSTGVYVVGSTDGILPGNKSVGSRDAFVSKYSLTNGVLVWSRQFGTSAYEYATGVVIDSSGIYVAGDTLGSLKGTAKGSGDAFIRKYDKTGSVLWTDQFGTNADDGAAALAVDSKGVYITGTTYGKIGSDAKLGGSDSFIRKYNGSGTALWTKQFGTKNDDFVDGIAVDTSGVYAVGYKTIPYYDVSYNRTFTTDDGFITKFSTSGSAIWSSSIQSNDYTSYETADAIGVDSTGVYVAGQGVPTGATGNGNAYIRKYMTTDGSILWTNSLPSYPTSMAVDSTGISIGGFTYNYIAGNYDAFFSKLQVTSTYISGGGRAINGYLTGAMALFDANRNGVLDSGEPSTLTSSTGDFDLQVPSVFDTNANGILDDEEGQWVVFGGTDSSTGLPAVDQLVAPASWSVVTPLTTLVATLSTNYGLTVADAEMRVRDALGIPNVELSGFDPIAATLAGDPNAPAVFAAHAALQDTIAQAIAVLSGASTSSSPSELASTLFDEIVARIAQPDSVVAFNDESTIQSLLVSAADDVAIMLDNDLVIGAASVIAANNQLLDEIPLTSDIAYLSQVAQIKTVSQGAVAPELKLAAHGEADIQVVVDQSTGAALSTQVAAAAILPTIAPPTDIFAQATSNSGATVEFSLSAVDFAGQSVSVVSVPSSGSVFAIGDTVVTSTATDSLGHSRSTTFMIHVSIPNVAPTLNADQTFVTVEMGYTATVTGAFLDLNVADQVNLTASIGNISQTQGAAGGWTWSLAADSKSFSQTVFITATDQLGESSTISFPLTVINHLPTANAGGPYTVGEGGALTLDASRSFDPDQENPTLTYFWDLDGDGVFGETGNAAGRGDELGVSPGFSAAGLDGPSTSNVVLHVIDDSGAIASAVVPISVFNVAPTVTLAGSTDSVRGQTRTFTFGALDSPADQAAGFKYIVNWGDNSPLQTINLSANNGTGVAADHVYNTNGTYTVAVTATDKDGLASLAVNSAIAVTTMALQPDSLNLGQMMFVIGGSTANDTMRISVEDDHHDHNDDDAQFVTVRINDHDEARHKVRGTFALPVSRIVVYAQAGNDDVKMDDHSTIPAWLYGGDGNDRLKGGAGHDVLLGEAGDDLLSGSEGRDLMIGGTGADRIIGNAGDDILIAGTTAHDNRAAALFLIMKEWTRTDASFLARVAHLENGGGWNAGYRLNDTTVHDDHAEDVLTGSDGNDWFLFNRDGDGGVKDKVTDLSAFEALYALDLDWLSN